MLHYLINQYHRQQSDYNIFKRLKFLKNAPSININNVLNAAPEFNILDYMEKLPVLHLIHKHIVVSASGLTNPPHTPEVMNEWLAELVSLVGMKILMEPRSHRCEDFQNEGVTGMVGITTSHSSVHCWDMVDEPFLKMDLYSCQEFEAKIVLDHLVKFGPSVSDYMVIDRDRNVVLETGKIVYRD